MSELLPGFDAWKLAYPPEYDEEDCDEYYLPGDDPQIELDHCELEPSDADD